jgi:hypothetical protein
MAEGTKRPDGTNTTYEEAFARFIRDAAFGKCDDGKPINSRVQALAVEALLERFDPVIREMHIADTTQQVQVELGDKAREFAKLCAEAGAHDAGRLGVGGREIVASLLAIRASDVAAEYDGNGQCQ